MMRFGLAAALAMALSACSIGGISISPLVASAPTPRPAEKAEPILTARSEVVAAVASVEPLAYSAPMTGGNASLNGLISKYAAHYGVPEGLVHRVVKRESTYNPAARNGPYYGLMQISHATARSMGYKGEPAGLLDAETNLRYAVKYLRGAWLVADHSEDGAVRNYSRGYYYDAKAKGLLKEVGLR